jgi:hypothetical protein
VRQLQPGMRTLLLVAAVLVFLAGVQLFVFTERTDRYFAWTIQPPLTAAFLGAAYWSSVAFELLASRAKAWADARIAVPAVFVFTTLTLIATLVHRDKFHFVASFEASTRAVTWAWLAVYTVVPILMVVLWVRQARAPGGDPPRDHPLPVWLTALVCTQAVVLLALGAWMFVAPTSAAEVWAWPLTELTGRAIAAWLLGLGVAAAHAVWERDAVRLRPAAVAYLGFGILETWALARYRDTVDWSSPEGLALAVFVASTLVTGAAALLVGRERTSGSDQPDAEG